jgi:hypothetical protein
MLSKQCKLHLKEENTTAFAHMSRALKVAVKLQLAVPALIIHSIAPRFFTNTASNVMKNCLGDFKK